MSAPGLYVVFEKAERDILETSHGVPMSGPRATEVGHTPVSAAAAATSIMRSGALPISIPDPSVHRAARLGSLGRTAAQPAVMAASASATVGSAPSAAVQLAQLPPPPPQQQQEQPPKLPHRPTSQGALRLAGSAGAPSHMRSSHRLSRMNTAGESSDASASLVASSHALHRSTTSALMPRQDSCIRATYADSDVSGDADAFAGDLDVDVSGELKSPSTAAGVRRPVDCIQPVGHSQTGMPATSGRRLSTGGTRLGSIAGCLASGAASSASDRQQPTAPTSTPGAGATYLDSPSNRQYGKHHGGPRAAGAAAAAAASAAGRQQRKPYTRALSLGYLSGASSSRRGGVGTDDGCVKRHRDGCVVSGGGCGVYGSPPAITAAMQSAIAAFLDESGLVPVLDSGGADGGHADGCRRRSEVRSPAATCGLRLVSDTADSRMAPVPPGPRGGAIAALDPGPGIGEAHGRRGGACSVAGGGLWSNRAGGGGSGGGGATRAPRAGIRRCESGVVSESGRGGGGQAFLTPQASLLELPCNSSPFVSVVVPTPMDQADSHGEVDAISIPAEALECLGAGQEGVVVVVDVNASPRAPASASGARRRGIQSASKASLSAPGMRQAAACRVVHRTAAGAGAVAAPLSSRYQSTSSVDLKMSAAVAAAALAAATVSRTTNRQRCGVIPVPEAGAAFRSSGLPTRGAVSGKIDMLPTAADTRVAGGSGRAAAATADDSSFHRASRFASATSQSRGGVTVGNVADRGNTGGDPDGGGSSGGASAGGADAKASRRSCPVRRRLASAIRSLKYRMQALKFKALAAMCIK